MFITLGAVAGVLLLIGALTAVAIASDGDRSATPAQPAAEDDTRDELPAQPPTTPQAPGTGPGSGVGEEARDGVFAFTVTQVETGVQSVGDEFFGETAQGEFVIVHLTAKNVGDVPQFFTDADQRLFDTEGKEYAVNFTADLLLNEDGSSFYEEINPGLSIEVKIAFDVADGTEPGAIELHEAPGSPGVTVSLK
ncbi:DUF4352 domain-containing protein [Phytomonospora sp. NPDC050363]|uniref:DUF4352 domain-containing protein n=1 Tax=Phytomonospora sp. NPDC050363 TaxID=3155642 RepID=UPI0033C2CD5C